jgi:ornithine cyclodeaminase
VVATAGVMGTGALAGAHIAAAQVVRPFRWVRVWGREPATAAACAQDFPRGLGIAARAEADPARLVAESQLVVTATPSERPILSADWLHPGLHITAMGADQPGKTEIDPRVLAEADAYVCDRVSQCERSGELAGARAAGLWAGGTPAELGEVIAGTRPGRSRPEDITVCDLTGTGAQDTAIATHALGLCRGAGLVLRA